MKARERQQQRRHSKDMVSKTGRSPRKQAAPEGEFKMPEIRLPGGQWLLLIPAGLILIFAVIFALRLLTPADTSTPPNAIWLDKTWAYQERGIDELISLAGDLQEHNIGTIFLFVSSLKSDGTWSGVADGRNLFSEVEPRLDTLIGQIRSVYPNVQIFAWIEVAAVAPDYRLGDEGIQNTIATFSARMMSQLDFDGVLLDVKPIFEENEDYIQILRTVRRQIGVEAILAVAVPPDLTPSGTSLNLPPVIAPATEWSNEYKQRIALLVNHIVIAAYNSYQSNPVDYIDWVTYQVNSYVEALSALESGTTVWLSIPNYRSNPPAHDEAIESLAGGLDGANNAIVDLSEEEGLLFNGVAIYTDRLLTDAEWAVYRSKWRN